MDKIVFINQWTSYRMKDIINLFAEKVDDVSLIAGTISNTGNILNKKVKVTHIIKYNRESLFSRKITWVLATIQIIFLINTKFRNYYLFITTNPPTSAFITLFCNNKYSVKVLDIYPDALSVAGFTSKKSMIYKLWERQNKKYFGGAEHIFTFTDGMARTIAQYCNSLKIKVIPQWSSSDGYINIAKRQNEFIKLHSLEKFFIIMYSGNIGLGHHVASLVETANILKDHKDILFVIIGEGWNKPVIEKLINEYELTNCLLLPFQSHNMFKHSIQAADIGVVSVSKELAPVCVPSKTYNLINNEIPLIFITEGESELATLASKYEIGKCFTPNQNIEISEFIISLKTEEDIFLKYKKNLNVCAHNFTSKNALIYVNSILQ